MSASWGHWDKTHGLGGCDTRNPLSYSPGREAQPPGVGWFLPEALGEQLPSQLPEVAPNLCAPWLVEGQSNICLCLRLVSSLCPRVSLSEAPSSYKVRPNPVRPRLNLTVPAKSYF